MATARQVVPDAGQEQARRKTLPRNTTCTLDSGYSLVLPPPTRARTRSEEQRRKQPKRTTRKQAPALDILKAYPDTKSIDHTITSIPPTWPWRYRPIPTSCGRGQQRASSIVRERSSCRCRSFASEFYVRLFLEFPWPSVSGDALSCPSVGRWVQRRNTDGKWR